MKSIIHYIYNRLTIVSIIDKIQLYTEVYKIDTRGKNNTKSLLHSQRHLMMEKVPFFGIIE